MDHRDASTIRIATAVAMRSLETSFHQFGSQPIWLPPIGSVTGSCEQISRNVPLASTPFGPEGFLLQTGQIGLEAALASATESASTTIVSVRGEPEDERHLQQFLLAEEESSWKRLTLVQQPDPRLVLGALCSRIESVVRASINALLESNILSSAREAELMSVLGEDWPRIQYDRAADQLQIDISEQVVDFGATHEAELIRRNCGKVERPLFITDFPAEIKFFNMRNADDLPGRVLSVDLVLPIAGEAVGGAVREDRVGLLTEKLNSSLMLADHIRAGGARADFDRYLTLMADGAPPHAGYGLGVERLLQFVFGLSDIRLASSISHMRALVSW